MIGPIFQKNFKMLRKTHNVSVRNLAALIGLKSYTLVSYWEQGRNLPTFDSIVDICILFGVSTDWLIGNIRTPYHEEFISRIEIVVLYCLSNDSKSSDDVKNILNTLPDCYLHTNDRKKTYSRPVRANIAFLIQWLYFLTYQPRDISRNRSFHDFFNNIPFDNEKVSIDSIGVPHETRRIITTKIIKDELYFYLQKLLSEKKSALPIFDLVKEIKSYPDEFTITNPYD